MKPKTNVSRETIQIGAKESIKKRPRQSQIKENSNPVRHKTTLTPF